MSDHSEIFTSFEDYLQDARFKVSYGGRGSGKTRTFCTILLNNVKDFGWKVVGFREIMESIADSVYSYAMDIIEATRKHPALSLGASPRATLTLLKISQVIALMFLFLLFLLHLF